MHCLSSVSSRILAPRELISLMGMLSQAPVFYGHGDHYDAHATQYSTFVSVRAVCGLAADILCSGLWSYQKLALMRYFFLLVKIIYCYLQLTTKIRSVELLLVLSEVGPCYRLYTYTWARKVAFANRQMISGSLL